MAAILEPQRFPRATPAPRPELRLIHGGLAPARSERGPEPVALVLAGLLVLLLMAGAIAVGRGALAGLAPAPVTSSAPAAAAPGARTVVVEPGDTLWSIARRLQPEGDVRPLVDRLVAAHGSSVIAAGDRIALPN